MRKLVIIPTYNELESLPITVGRLRAAVPDSDVLIVDDNSPDGTGALAGHEDVDVAAHLFRGGDRLRRRLVEVGVVVLRQDQDGHQITPASVLSFAISSSTEPTFTPALRVAGSTVFSTLSRGVTSTP